MCLFNCPPVVRSLLESEDEAFPMWKEYRPYAIDREHGLILMPMYNYTREIYELETNKIVSNRPARQCRPNKAYSRITHGIHGYRTKGRFARRTMDANLSDRKLSEIAKYIIHG